MEIFVWIMFILLPMMGLRAETNITESVIRLTQRMNDADLTILSLQAEVTSLKTTLDLLVADSETGVSINVTALKEDVLTAVSTQLHLQWSSVNRRMIELEQTTSEQQETLTGTKEMVIGNREMFGYLNDEISKIRDDLDTVKDQQASLTTTVDSHMSSYLQQIQDSVDRRERCQTGTIHLYEKTELPAESTKPVVFETPFQRVPSMSFGVIHMDALYDHNLRYSLQLIDITQSGFTFQASPWERHVFALAISWMACPN